MGFPEIPDHPDITPGERQIMENIVRGASEEKLSRATEKMAVSLDKICAEIRAKLDEPWLGLPTQLGGFRRGLLSPDTGEKVDVGWPAAHMMDRQTFHGDYISRLHKVWGRYPGAPMVCFAHYLGFIARPGTSAYFDEAYPKARRHYAADVIRADIPDEFRETVARWFDAEIPSGRPMFIEVVERDSSRERSWSSNAILFTLCWAVTEEFVMPDGKKGVRLIDEPKPQSWRDRALERPML
jgi:hypothetical protein